MIDTLIMSIIIIAVIITVIKSLKESKGSFDEWLKRNNLTLIEKKSDMLGGPWMPMTGRYIYKIKVLDQGVEKNGWVCVNGIFGVNKVKWE